jgi:hypothetical protein
MALFKLSSAQVGQYGEEVDPFVGLVVYLHGQEEGRGGGQLVGAAVAGTGCQEAI